MKITTHIMSCLCLWALSTTPVTAQKKQPNIILIMADDMGYSDIGSYGGEIKTPHIDGLAATGIRFKQFYNAARCCPTRSSLMTGLYPHQAGMGWMVLVGTQTGSGNFSSVEIPADGNYRIGLYFGKLEAGNVVWVDDVTFNAI